MNRLSPLVLALVAASAVALPVMAEEANPATPVAAEAAATPAPDEIVAAATLADTRKTNVKADAKADAKAADAPKPVAENKAAPSKPKLDQEVIRKRREAGAVAAKEQNANNGAVSPGPDGTTKFIVAKPRPTPVANPG